MKIEIDETNIEIVSELIDKAACLMEDDEYMKKEEIVKELKEIEDQLKSITSNEICITDYWRYWSAMDLEDCAKIALTPKPKKSNLSEDKLREIIHNICEGKYEEYEYSYYLELLEVETGLDNITDYIYYPEEVGFGKGIDPSSDEITDKILQDRK